MRNDIDNSEYNEHLEEDCEDEGCTVECNFCQREIYDDASQCPYCGNYVSAEDSSARKPLWIIVTAVILLSVLLYECLGQFIALL